MSPRLTAPHPGLLQKRNATGKRPGFRRWAQHLDRDSSSHWRRRSLQDAAFRSRERIEGEQLCVPGREKLEGKAVADFRCRCHGRQNPPRQACIVHKSRTQPGRHRRLTAEWRTGRAGSTANPDAFTTISPLAVRSVAGNGKGLRGQKGGSRSANPHPALRDDQAGPSLLWPQAALLLNWHCIGPLPRMHGTSRHCQPSNHRDTVSVLTAEPCEYCWMA